MIPFLQKIIDGCEPMSSHFTVSDRFETACGFATMTAFIQLVWIVRG